MNWFTEEEIQTLKMDINDTFKHLPTYNQVMQAMVTQGVCRADVTSLENLWGETPITDQMPLMGFMPERHHMHVEIAMESIVGKIVQGIGKGLTTAYDKLIALLKRFLEWLGKLTLKEVKMPKVTLETLDEQWPLMFKTHYAEYLESSPSFIYGIDNNLAFIGEIAAAMNHVVDNVVEASARVERTALDGYRADKALGKDIFANYVETIKPLYQMTASQGMGFTSVKLGQNRWQPRDLNLAEPETPYVLEWFGANVELFRELEAEERKGTPKDIADFGPNLPAAKDLKAKLDQIETLTEGFLATLEKQRQNLGRVQAWWETEMRRSNRTLNQLLEDSEAMTALFGIHRHTLGLSVKTTTGLTSALGWMSTTVRLLSDMASVQEAARAASK